MCFPRAPKVDATCGSYILCWFPEKYVAVVSGVPSALHPRASTLVLGRQSPPIFALYWDKKVQFSLQVGSY
jgi:hypothetical protein